MNRNISSLLKNKPELEYWYECIKLDPENKPIKIGELIKTTQENINPEYYKLIATYRKAHIGDLQQQLNECFGRDLMKEFAENGHGNIPVYYTRYEKIYIRETILDSLKRYFKNKINISSFLKKINFIKKYKNKKEENFYLENILFGEKQKDISASSKVKEFFNYNKEN